MDCELAVDQTKGRPLTCLGDKLGDAWWQDSETLQREVDAHGSLRAAADAHDGVGRTAIREWAKRLGVKAPQRQTSLRIVPTSSEPVSREEILEAEVTELRALVKQRRSTDVADERLVQVLEATVAAKTPIYEPMPSTKRKPGAHTPHEMLLDWSDLHAAERVSLEQMNGINEYDWSIMMRRHDRMIEAIRSFREKLAYPVSRLQIAALGDMVTGDIHEELRETNEMVLMEAAIQLGLDGANFIEALIPDFERIDVDGVVGNHGRRSKKPAAKNAYDNFDWLVYHIIRLRLAKYPSVKVTVPKASQHPIKMCDRFTILMFHGDGIRSTMPGVPWGGVARRTRELERQFEPVVGPIDHFLCGHFHQWSVTDGGRVIVNGSVKGPDEYSIKQFGGGCEAVQLLHLFHPERGMVSTHPLKLEIDERSEPVARLRRVA